MFTVYGVGYDIIEGEFRIEQDAIEFILDEMPSDNWYCIIDKHSQYTAIVHQGEVWRKGA